MSTIQPLAGEGTVLTDRALGISFLRIAPDVKLAMNVYTLSLQEPGGTIKSATATIGVSNRPAVDLSGSYGGTVYLDDPKTSRLLENRVSVDTVNIGGLQFRREYWAVYAGMGAWEGVINCYALHNRQYFTVSLTSDFTLEKPGEVVDGTPLTSGLLQSRLVGILKDVREPVVKRFNDLLSSFQVIN